MQSNIFENESELKKWNQNHNTKQQQTFWQWILIDRLLSYKSEQLDKSSKG